MNNNKQQTTNNNSDNNSNNNSNNNDLYLYMNLDWFCHTCMLKEVDEKEMNPFGFAPVRILFIA